MKRNESIGFVNLRDIRCPVCLNGKILIEKNTLHDSKLQIYSPNDAENAEWFVKCPKCKNQIGLGFK